MKIMADDYKRLKVDVEDILTLALSFSPEEVKSKINDSIDKIDDIINTIDDAFSSHPTIGLENILSKFDVAINFISPFANEFSSQIVTMREIFGFLTEGRNNASSIISIISGFLPSGVKSILSEGVNIINSVYGIVHFIKNLNPQSIAQNFVSGLVGSIINKLPNNIFTNILGNIFGGSSLSNILGNIFGNLGGSNPISGIVDTVFGRCCSTASIKPMDIISGGFEAPDTIILSEKHIRGAIEEEENNG